MNKLLMIGVLLMSISLGVNATETERHVSNKSKCHAGDGYACSKVAYDYYLAKNGIIYEDHLKALEYYKKACRLGDADSCIEVGESYENGDESIEQDFSKAIVYYKKACNLLGGDDIACDWAKQLERRSRK